MSNIILTVGTSLDKRSVQETQAQLTKISKEMQRDIQFSDLGKETKKYEQAAKQVMQVNRSLGVNFSDTLKKFNTDGFVRDLKAMGINIDHLSDKLEDMGYEGIQSLQKFTMAMKSSNVEIVKTQGLLEKTGTTLGKTFIWSMANRSIDVMTRSVQQAIGYTKELDKSLTNISIVTDLTSQQMDRFAESANKASAKLGQTTLDYTEAALLYLQQGRSMEETSELVNATLIGANITGEETAQMSELLTAALNGYNLAAKDAMDVTDKFAAVGAATGSDFFELATAFSKTASMASIVGVSFDQLTAQIATISTVTREAPESIGTSLKTIYGRLTEMKSGQTDEEGFTIGKAEQAFKTASKEIEGVTLSLLNADGTLKDMGILIEEVGDSWQYLSREAQVALANAMAGSRQANRLIALFQNWEMYQDALATSTNSAGAAIQQNEKYMDSFEAKANELRASMEELWMNMLDSDVLKSFVEGLTALVKVLGTLTDMLGGIGPIMAMVGVSIAKNFGTKLAFQGIDSLEAFGKEAKNVLGGIFVKDVNAAMGSFDGLSKKIKEGSGGLEEFSRKFKIPTENFEQLKGLSQSLGEQRLNLEKLQKTTLLDEKELQSAQEVLDTKKKSHDLLVEEIERNKVVLQDRKSALKTSQEDIKFKETMLKIDEQSGTIKVQNAEKVRVQIEQEKISQQQLNDAYQEQRLKVIALGQQRSASNQQVTLATAAVEKTEENILAIKRQQAAITSDIAVKEQAVGKVLDQSAMARKKSLQISKAISLFGLATQGIGAIKQLGEAINEVEGRGKNLAEVLTSGIGMAVGAFFGGPMGATLGASMGKWVGSLVDFKTPLEKAYKDVEDFTNKVDSLTQQISDAKSIDEEIKSLVAIKGTNEEKLKQVEISNRIAELFPEMVKGYDLEGNAIVDLTASYLDLVEAKKKAWEESKEGQEAAESRRKVALAEIKSNYGQEGYSATKDVSVLMEDFNKETDIADADKEVQKLVLSLVDYERIAKEIKDGKSLDAIGEEYKVFVNSALGMSDKLQQLDSLPANIKSIVTELMSMVNEGQELSFLDKIIIGPNGEVDLDLIVSEFDKVKKTTQTLLKETFDSLDKRDLQGLILDMAKPMDLKVDMDKLLTLNENQLIKILDNMMNKLSQGEQTVYQQLKDMGIKISEDELALVNQIYGTDEQWQAKELQAKIAMEKSREEFFKTYDKAGYEDMGDFMDAENAYIKKFEDNQKVLQQYIDANARYITESGEMINTTIGEVLEAQSEIFANSESSMEEKMDAYETIAENIGDLFSQEELLAALGPGFADEIDTVFDALKDGLTDLELTTIADEIERLTNGMIGFGNQATIEFLELNATSAEVWEEMKAANKDYFESIRIAFGDSAAEAVNYQQFRMELDYQLSEYKDLLNQADVANFVNSLTEQDRANIEALTGMELNEETFHKNWEKLKETEPVIAKRVALEIQKAQIKSAMDSNAALQREIVAAIAAGETGINTMIQAINASAVAQELGIQLSTVDFANQAEAAINSLQAEYRSMRAQYESIDTSIKNLGSGGWTPESYKPTKPGGSGYTPNKPGYTPPKDSSGKKDKEQKDVEDLEYEKDIYHDINIELEKMADNLEKLQNIEDLLYGQGKLDNLKQQEDIMKRQMQLTKEKLALAKQEAAQARSDLAGMGVKFDESGAITNYNDIIQQKVNWANSLTGDAKKEAQNTVKAFQDALKNYEDLQFNVILDYENEIEKMRQAIQDKIIEAINYEYEFNIEASVRFKEDVDFFDKFLEGFEEMPDKIERSIEAFNKQYDSLDAFSKRYNDIINNSELDPMKKAEALEELKEDFKDVMLDLKSIYDAINKYILDTIQKNVDAVNNHVKAFKEINDEMADLLSMYELLGEGMNYDALNEVLGVQAESNEAQIDTLKRAQKEMEAFRDSLEEGSEEWKKADEAVKEMDKDIRKLALETVKIYQQQLENSFKKSISEINKALSGGLGLDKLEKEIEKTRKEQDKYYDSVEKTLWASKMQKQIQEEINKATDPKKREQLQKFYDQEIDTLLQKDKLTAAEVERAEILYDIALKQMALDEARANKTIMRLVRDESGNWVYQYMTDMQAVKAAQESLSGSLENLLAHDKQVYRDSQDEILDRRKQFIADMQDLFAAYKSGEIKDEEEFNRLLGELQNEFNLDMMQLNSEFADAERNLAESTLASIMDAYDITYGDLANLTEEQKQMFENAGITLGDSWESTIDNMVSKNDDFLAQLIKQFDEPGGVQDIINTALDNLKDSMDSYGDNVKSMAKQAGMDMKSMKDKIDQAKDSTNKLKEETDKVIQVMQKEFKEITENILPAYDKIKDKFKDLQKEVQNYIDKIESAIQKQKELAQKPPTPAPTPTPGGGGGGSTNTGGGNSQPSRGPGVGDIVRSVPGTWYSDSYSGAPTGTPSKWAKEFKVTSHKTDGRPRPWHIVGTNGGTGSGWVEWVGFKSGGYTGDWSKSDGMDSEGGKLALLHQKEMVLNSDDTKNILDAVSLVRDYAQSLKFSGINVPSTEDNKIIQNVEINADFSGVKNSNEIEQAFDNLVNRAAQYARQVK